jgi:YVTN family beta-propeller protein
MTPPRTIGGRARRRAGDCSLARTDSVEHDAAWRDRRTDGRRTGTIAVGREPIAVAISPDGSRAYVTNYKAKTVSVIDVSAGTVMASVPVAHEPSGVTVAPDGRRAYVAVKVGESPHGLAVTGNGQQVYVADSGSNAVSVIDDATGAVVSTIQTGNSPYDLKVSPDGLRLYITNRGAASVSALDIAR